MIAAFIGTETEAPHFVDWMNTLWEGLNFTYEWSNTEINYIDVKLVVTEDRRLETDRFVKPTNPQLFLHFKSNHPRSCFKGIVYGYALGVKMICSREEDVEKHMKKLHEKCYDRGHPPDMVREQLARGAQLERVDLLRPKPIYPTLAGLVPAASKPKFRATFVVTYNPQNPPLKQWPQEAYICLQTDSKMSEIYTKPPSVVTRQAPSLKRLLTTSTF